MLSSEVKFSAEKQTDGQTDRQMDIGKAICPDLSMRGHKKHIDFMRGKTNTEVKAELRPITIHFYR